MSLRLFAALPIPDNLADTLLTFQKNLPGARWRGKEHFHITLRFFDEVQEPVAEELDAALEEAATRTKPFDVRVKGAGAFGGAEPHALIMKVEESPALSKLAADCERAARRVGLKPETRKFAPHVTIAYLNRPLLQDVHAFERAHALFAPPAWRADMFGMYSSWLRKDGPSLYRLEADYPLTG